MTINFYVRYTIHNGQKLYVTGNCAALGNDDAALAVPLKILNEQYVHGQIEVTQSELISTAISYRYFIRDANGIDTWEWEDNKIIPEISEAVKAIEVLDTWNHAGTIDNAFFTKPFRDVLLKNSFNKEKIIDITKGTHVFKVKCPLLQSDEIVCLVGSGNLLGDWNTAQPFLLSKNEDWWTTALHLTESNFPIFYKYGIYNLAEKRFVRYESGDNRALPGDGQLGKLTILHDGFVQLPDTHWKGAGVAIPVFSLRSNNSFGTGEFTDIKLLVDWAKQTGLKLIQLLPINDTTATHTYLDSYPYAAVSAFGLNPLFLNVEKVAGGKDHPIIKSLQQQQQELNALPTVDFERVMPIKWAAIKALYEEQKAEFKDDIKYFEFFDLNRHWLTPYAVFCHLRDTHQTADFSQWPMLNVYDEAMVQELAAPDQPHYYGVALHYFIQYHLHLQLKSATNYAHKNGVVLKGDLPIGIYRYSCDAWMSPDLYHMDQQAGAPPDDFAIKGQNWGFPTYNWQRMEQDNFSWWRQRFEQMSAYFDAFRIDHILGFFRIWSIPLDAVQGLLGHFVPAIPIHINELFQQNISFQYHRYCKPYITKELVDTVFGGLAKEVKANYLIEFDDALELQTAFDTQRKVADYFLQQPSMEDNTTIKNGLLDLISNVILIEEKGSQMQQFHFRINMKNTHSFQQLDAHSQHKLESLYIDYFFRRQDDFWRKEAIRKLPELKRSTDMLVCGEDLGMVPHCVPEVMEQLGLLSLEIQRMPKRSGQSFFHPKDAPYLSVVTPATHDMSTISAWWQEDRNTTQTFYNTILCHHGEAPVACEPYIHNEIIEQHLHSPAMWCIFQIQDILSNSATLSSNDPTQDRINIPADPQHYWRYRMHIKLEDLLEENIFNTDFKNAVHASGR